MVEINISIKVPEGGGQTQTTVHPAALTQNTNELTAAPLTSLQGRHDELVAQMAMKSGRSLRQRSADT